jgi:hypothetical protein
MAIGGQLHFKLHTECAIASSSISPWQLPEKYFLMKDPNGVKGDGKEMTENGD